MAVLGFVAMVLGFGVYCATHSVDFQVYSPHFFGALVMLVALVLVAVRMKSTEHESHRRVRR